MEQNLMEMTNEVENVMDTTEEIVEAAAKSKGGLLSKILAGLGLAACAGGAAYVVKNREKIKEKKLKKQIAKLEKAGYLVAKPEEIMDEIVGIDDLDEEESKE